MANHHDLANFIWQIADLLRGPYRPPQYERVMLPMDGLRGLRARARVQARIQRLAQGNPGDVEPAGE